MDLWKHCINDILLTLKRGLRYCHWQSEIFSIYSGTADLSIYFNELGLSLLAEKGIISYITTNKFFNTGYGEKVRKQLSSQHINIILNFEQVEVFEDVLVSSVIFNVSKKNKMKKESVCI